MNAQKITLFFIMGLVIFTAHTVHAQVINFDDTQKYWPGWNNKTSDDTNDSIGIPNFTSGTATVTNEHLNNITFNRQSGSSSYWGILSPGDLFIDLDANQTWDFVVDLSLTPTWTAAGINNTDATAGNYSIYAISLALNDTSGYILSGRDNTGGWKGYLVRDSHPVAVKNIPTENSGSVYFSGWDTGTGSTTHYSFDFTNGGLNLGESGEFAISWMPNCANDVVYEKLQYTVTPEPATVSLLAVGLSGLLFRRKKTV